jgi:hypothetical protein
MENSTKNGLIYSNVNVPADLKPTKNSFHFFKKQFLFLFVGLILSTGVIAKQQNRPAQNRSLERRVSNSVRSNNNISLHDKKDVSKITVSDTSDCLEVTGKFDGTVKDFNGVYTATLILDNTVIGTQIMNVRKSFVFVLNKNNLYTVKVEKEGFIPKMISISTKVDGKLDDKNSYVFKFETNLLSKDLQGNFDDDDIDFPVALVSYNKTCDCFEYNAEYTNSLMQRLISNLICGI